jgi:hypothetical protein
VVDRPDGFVVISQDRVFENCEIHAVCEVGSSISQYDDRDRQQAAGVMVHIPRKKTLVTIPSLRVLDKS